MGLKERIAKLEEKLLVTSITLVMPDGKTHRIPGDGQYLLGLFCEATAREYAKREGLPLPEAKHAVEIDLIVRSVSNDEEGSLIKLIQVLAHGPAPTPSESEASK